MGYANASGFDFIKQVPTAWDETRFIDGSPESHIVLAGRKGRQWYIGAMTNGIARKVAIPLSLLGPGRFEATIWQDGASPNEVDRTMKTVSSGDTLSIAMSASGGAAIRISPANRTSCMRLPHVMTRRRPRSVQTAATSIST